jgi:hypothetical protein
MSDLVNLSLVDGAILVATLTVVLLLGVPRALAWWSNRQAAGGDPNPSGQTTIDAVDPREGSSASLRQLADHIELVPADEQPPLREALLELTKLSVLAPGEPTNQ